MAFDSKMAGRRATRSERWVMDNSNTNKGTLDLGSFGALVSKWLVTEQNGVKFEIRGEVIHIWGTFDLVVFKAIWGPFGALVSRWPVSQKWLVVERDGVKFETREQ